MERLQTLAPLTLTLSPHWGEGNKDGAFLNPLATITNALNRVSLRRNEVTEAIPIGF